MSRRPNAAADKAAANTAVIKNLLKLPGNKVCADCKRNKLPRWASWNLGIFICIRCSGIHRGMGTHISKVKSVDLDSWTDEQLQSVVKWGNTKANKYWEANLAPGHVPSEAKIENFIRTKYESKRWVMEGGIPDPSTLDDEDDDNVPLKQVQEKLEHRKSAGISTPQPAAPVVSKSANINLFDDEPISTPVAKAAAPAPAQPTKTPDSASLLGLDFFAPADSPSPRPSSIISDPGSKPAAPTGRPDYKSILSLYASAAPRQQIVQPQHSPTMNSYGVQPNFSSLNDSFNSLSFGQTQTATPAIQQTAQPAPAKPSPFANLTAGMKKSVAAPQVSKPSPGGFFSPPKTTPAASASSGLGDLFDFGTPAAPAQPTHSHSASMSSLSGMSSMSSAAPTSSNNAFANLAFETNAWVTPAPTTTAATTTNSTSNNWGGMGGMNSMGNMGNSSLSSTAAWGAPVMTTPAMNAFANTTSSAWGSSSTTTTTAPAVSSFAPTSPGNVWGSTATTTAPAAASKPAASFADEEDWGNFSSGTTVQSTPAPVKVQAGGFDDDVFGNVWK
ncbi:putative GTPase activating protein for Arf-domain-containing protein [Pyronema omphalodes]|nr:putative GTPase activating protein for Arf-domain-containing protein [Pyronema omphalodes]